MKKTDFIFGLIWLFIGIALSVLSFFETLDAFWSGMGSALTCIGIVRLLRGYRLHKREEYREQKEVAQTDERYQFLCNKAWRWAGTLFVLIIAVAVIVLKLLGQELLYMALGCSMLLLIVLFWCCFWILNKKY